MPIREATSDDGTTIVYRVSGPEAARPLVLLHGWAASLRCWGDEVLDSLSKEYRVVALDLRGHGYSGAPESGYDNPKNWAADVAAVLAAERITAGAVLLGWSYGGLVLCDYLAVDGTSAVAGIVFVGGITGIGRGQGGGRVGPAMREAIPGVYSEKPGVALRAFGAFGDANTGARDNVGAVAQNLFGISLSTPPRVREALFAREAGNDDLLRDLDVPALIVHGSADPVVEVSVAQHGAQLLRDVRVSIWEGTKHAPFVEDPARFVAEITTFVAGLDRSP
ncbi:alpha/beta fold hydrolase [Antrihabitans sp. NCIMB 15449]|uniref:Alpha/beta fold hydrolase n=1 Tax=Antrihabitans spumae TaxID=3373370 RepID=A0ABW7JVQ7_9NOCA